LRPSHHYRPQEATVEREFVKDYCLLVKGDCFEVLAGDAYPPLRLRVTGQHSIFIMDRRKRSDIHFRVEEARGYPHTGDHWSPGAFALTLGPGKPATLIASTESWDVIHSKQPAEAREVEIIRRQELLQMAAPTLRSGLGAELVLAADQFIITPAGRPDETVNAKASGSEARTIIAGYHWFTDWGRDTMISLEGLTMATGRHKEAGYILRTFANHVRDGLIPNMFPEHDKVGLYHTADATLWFFHALHRYIYATQDRETLRLVLPKLIDIVKHHLQGTLFNIGIDPADGLLKQGAEGYQLTWMDAKVNGWVVTPRRGKAVELNALWYNAVRLLEQWVTEEDSGSASAWLSDIATQTYHSFNERFWYAEGGYLYDVVDSENGDDAACRPNQLLSISLDFEVLQQQKWQPVFDTVTRELLAPYGLRTLSRNHPDYKLAYVGNLMARDAAYHQGTVWGWLTGVYVDSWLKVHPEAIPDAHKFLLAFDQHLNEAGLGTISEVFDAEAPYTPGGCISQAWSVGEILRCLVKTAPKLPEHYC
jgi:predicted glycogen debranching enzyme